MTMPGREFVQPNGKKHRYSINGQERSEELNDNLTTAQFWQYDSRIVRRWNMDPVVKENESPYLCFSGNPILVSDVNGDCGSVVGMGKSNGMGSVETVNSSSSTTYHMANAPYISQFQYTGSWTDYLKAIPNGVGSAWNGLVVDTYNSLGANVNALIDGNWCQSVKNDFVNLGNGIKNTAVNTWNYHTQTPFKQQLKDAWITLKDPKTLENAVSFIASVGMAKGISLLTKTVSATGATVYKSFSSNSIRFSQSSVNGLEDIVSSMKKSGWKGDPIDIVKMKDGMYTAVDNTRLLAAQVVGIDAKAIAHSFDDLIPADMAKRFLNKKGVAPTTWGEAVQNRIQGQNSQFRTGNTNGSFVRPTAKASGTN
jgi:hypothetical protein